MILTRTPLRIALGGAATDLPSWAAKVGQVPFRFGVEGAKTLLDG
jgi:galactokinase/mevalonate kinase-like predicted kinase